MEKGKLKYLLKLDKGKKKGFKALGYSFKNKNVLKKDLLKQVKNIDDFDDLLVKQSPYGTRYEITNIIKGSNGKLARLKTVWQIDKGSNTKRLITAIVKPFK